MADSANRRLDSWKEIADYLGRDVRTVIRWEKEKGLPVHRLPGGKRQAVFALTTEIDQWMLGQSEEGTETRSRQPAAPEAPEIGLPAKSPERHRSLRLGWALGVTAAFVLLIAGAALWIERPSSSAAAGPPALERPLRFARADYEAGAPRGIVSGDFNGDKKLDLAFTDSLNGSVVVLLGDGMGGFARRATSPTVSKSPEHIAIADFDGDGRLDMAVTSYFGGTEVEVLLGKGDGTFRQHFRFDVGGRSRWVAVGDLNDDGKPDLAVAGSAIGEIIVLFGHGDGTFREGGRYRAERDVAALALVDLDGDGALDIVANDYLQARGKSVSVYLNAKGGTFSERHSFPAGSGPLGLATADLNGDGRLDVVTANFPTTGSILFGTSAAGFAEPQSFDAGRGNGFVDVADLDRDGALDIIVLGEHSNTATILYGDGRGKFQRTQQIPTGDYPDGAVIADFDNDRKPDFAVLNIDGHSISVYINRGDAAAPRGWLARLLSPRTN